MNKDIRNFFAALSNSNRINFEYLHEQGIKKNSDGRAIGNFPQKSKMKFYSKEAIAEFDEWNKKGYGTFFLPNGGGYKDEEITEFRSSFVDIDIKDEIEYKLVLNGFDGTNEELKDSVQQLFEVISIHERASYKLLFMKRINELRKRGIIPSVIIETKNGYHVYYFLFEGATKEQFEQIEFLLIHCFNADTAVKNPARLLRIPDTLHLKNPSDPFKVELIEFNPDVRYDPETLINSLSTIEKTKDDFSLLFSNELKKGNIHKTKTVSKKHGIPVRTVIDYDKFNDGNIGLISRGMQGLHELKEKMELNNEISTRYIDRNDIRQYLKRQDLKQLLGLGERFYCLFHNSSNPSSACIYEKDERYYYKCHSNKCGVWYDIVEVIEKIARLENWETFDYLKELYNIAEVKTDWQTKQEKLIDINLDVIERFAYDIELKEKYRYLTKFLMTKGTIELLIKIHNIARRKLPQLAKMRDQLNNAVVFAPMNKVVEEILQDKTLGIDNVNNANTKMVIMIFMYILNCIGVDQLPKEMQDKAKELKKKGRVVNGVKVFDKYNTRYYEIVSLDAERLTLAEEMAKYYYDKKLSISTFKRDQILKLRGEEDAKRLFPDRTDEKVSGLSEFLAKEMERIMVHHIKDKGWITEKLVIASVVIPNFDMKQGFLNTFKYIQNKESKAIDSIHIKDDEPDMLRWYNNFMTKRFREIIPVIMDKHSLKMERLNKSVRYKFGLPEKMNGYIYILVEEGTENTTIPENKSLIKTNDKIHSLKLLLDNNPKESNYKLALSLGCSEGYIRKLKKQMVI